MSLFSTKSLHSKANRVPNMLLILRRIEHLFIVYNCHIEKDLFLCLFQLSPPSPTGCFVQISLIKINDTT